MNSQSLEQEFIPYKVALGFVEQFHDLIKPVDFNITIFGEKKDEDPKVIEGIQKAFSALSKKPVDSASNWAAERFMGEDERRFRASVRAVKLVQEELGLEIHQISNNLLRPIMEGIGSGYNDESIQSKWQKLLERSMAGKDVRAEYVRILENLDPVDARLLDFFYSHQKCTLEDVIQHAGIEGNRIELDVSLGKISEELDLFAVTNNDLGSSQNKGNLNNVRSAVSRQIPIRKTCSIDSQEPKSVANKGNITITIHFSLLGIGFMNCVTQELKPNPPSDNSSQNSAN